MVHRMDEELLRLGDLTGQNIGRIALPLLGLGRRAQACLALRGSGPGGDESRCEGGVRWRRCVKRQRRRGGKWRATRAWPLEFRARACGVVVEARSRANSRATRIRAGEARICAACVRAWKAHGGEKRSGGGGWVSGARAARDLRPGGRERGEAVEVGGRGRRWWATGHGGSGCRRRLPAWRLGEGGKGET